MYSIFIIRSFFVNRESYMAYCQYCGNYLNEGDLFCGNCGKKAPQSNSNSFVNNTVYDGTIHKCPNCGEILGSFVMRCPSCGFEIRDKQINPSLQRFIDDVSRLDNTIASNSSSGMGAIKIVILVLYCVSIFCCCCITLFILPLFIWGMIFLPSPLSIPEKNKEAFIRNYTFPNDRESLMQGLVYVKSKVDFLSAGKLNDKSIHWIRLWASKAEQLYQTSSLIIDNDETARKIYNSIIQTKNKAISSYIKKIVYSGLICLCLCVLMFVALRIFGKYYDSNSLLNDYITDDYITDDYISSVTTTEKNQFSSIVTTSTIIQK